MKFHRLLFCLAFLFCAFSIFAQVPDVDGYWSSSSGNKFYLEGYDGGFNYMNVSIQKVRSADYIGVKSGFETFRAKFSDGSFQLFMVVNRNEMRIIQSSDLSSFKTWRRVKQESTINNDYTPSSNTNVETRTRDCGYCKGTGNCIHCNYSGQSLECVRSTYGGNCKDKYCIAKNHQCKFCSGNHKCHYCGGTGRK